MAYFGYMTSKIATSMIKRTDLRSMAGGPGHTKCQYLVVACVTTLNVQWATDGMTGIHKVTSP
ncbi:hypothetical protein SFRURICE_018962 [Spodoptera frugiperda]|nr:hypothetical protein SFRURICE_018962 [Spodoptera frugiperda]